MRIAVFSDIHRYYEIEKIVDQIDVSSIDLVISLGDMYKDDLIYLNKSFSCEKIGVLGNHDSEYEFSNTEFVNIHEKEIGIKGLKIAGFGGCPRYKSVGINQYYESDVEPFINNLGEVDIFISHANPQIYEPFDYSDPYRGFKSFTNYINKNNKVLFLHGHVHENRLYYIGDTRIQSVYGHSIIEF